MENPALPSEVPSTERINSTTTIYQVPASTIFWKNFLAGASRALGTIVVYGMFWLLMLYIAQRTILPMLLPLLESTFSALETLQTTQQTVKGLSGGTASGPAAITPDLLRQLESLYGSSAAPAQPTVTNRATPM